MSELCNKKRMGSNVSRSTSRTSANTPDVSHHRNNKVSVRISRTSFRDFSECQTGTSLEIDIVGIDEGAQGPKGFTGEEVGLGPLSRNTW